MSSVYSEQPWDMELTLSEDGEYIEGQQEGLWNFCRLQP